MSRIVAIVQARMGSERLPGKSLVSVAGKPMLQHVVERLQRSALLTEVVIATSDHPRDRSIATLATDLHVRPVLGREQDVLARYALAAWQASASVVVRVTGDCPLIDPEIVDETIEAYLDDPRCAYAANVIERTFPRGCDTEVFSAESLFAADEEARLPHEREHVTPFIRSRPDRFPQQSVVAPEEWRRPQYRLCVDTPEDLALIRAVFDMLGPGNGFTMSAIVACLDRHPELPALNAHVEQKKAGE